MFNVFGSVVELLKIDKVCIDNNVFRLHYKATVAVLMAFAVLVTCRQYVGDPIDCIVDGVPSNVMDTYCWIHSTFTVPDRIGDHVGKNVVQPGVASRVDGEDGTVYHKYYQWVCVVLFVQALFFYAPGCMWKTWEGGRVKTLVMDLDCPIIDDQSKSDRKKLLVDYFAANLRAHDVYAVRFFFCEFLNFVNVVGQIIFMNYFLGSHFGTHGSEMAEPGRLADTMDRMFPKVTKCTFRKYGPSGTIQKFDGLCVLPLNIVNEKIYVFLCFWFMFVAVLSGLNLAYRVAIVVLPKFRLLLLKAKLRLAPPDQVETINKNCRIGDWFVLYQLGKNIDPLIFKEVISDLVKKLDGNENV